MIHTPAANPRRQTATTSLQDHVVSSKDPAPPASRWMSGVTTALTAAAAFLVFAGFYQISVIENLGVLTVATAIGFCAGLIVRVDASGRSLKALAFSERA